MQRVIKITILVFSILCLLYVAISYLLLDGRFHYETTFNSNSILESKAKGIFITDELIVKSSNKQEYSGHRDFEIWTNKRYMVTYYGFLFHNKTFIEGSRHLNIKVKPNASEFIKESCYYIIPNDKELRVCCGQIKTKVGDTISIVILDCSTKKRIQTLDILVK